MLVLLGKLDNYRQATLVGLDCYSGDPPADKDPLKAENPKITAKPRLCLIEPISWKLQISDAT